MCKVSLLRVIKHLHNFFVPHEGNDHLPHSVRHHNLLTYAGLLIAAKVFLLVVLVLTFPSVAQFSTITQNRVTQLVNEARTEAGLGTVTVNPVLQVAAQYKLDNMFANNYFAHNAPDGTEPWEWFKQAGYLYTYAGENLAMNFVEAEEVHAAWMASPTHRANILSPNFNEIGVAVGVGNIDGEEVTLVVQMFGKTYIPPTVVQKDIPSNDIEPEVKGEEIAITEEPTFESTPITETEPIPAPTQPTETFVEDIPLAHITPPETFVGENTVEDGFSLPPTENTSELALLQDPRIREDDIVAEPEPTPVEVVSDSPASTTAAEMPIGVVPEQAPVQEVTLTPSRQSRFAHELILFLRKFSIVLIAFVAIALLIKIFVKIRIQHKKTIIFAIAVILLGILLLLIKFHFLESVSGPVIIY